MAVNIFIIGNTESRLTRAPFLIIAWHEHDYSGSIKASTIIQGLWV